MAALQAGSDLEVLLLGLLAGLDQPPQGRRVGPERFLHEDVHPLLHGVLQLEGADVGKTGHHGHVVGAEAVDGFLIGVEADELSFLGYVDPVAELLGEGFVGPGEPVLHDVGHGIQLDRSERRVHGIADRPASPPAASDQGQANRVVLPRVDSGNADSQQGGSGCSGTGPPQKLPA